MRARQLLEEALALWHGPPLADFFYWQFAKDEADRLEDLRVVALEVLVEARLACGEHAELINMLNSLVATHPSARGTAASADARLYRSGRQAEALSAYREGRKALDDLGLQPGPQLRQLEQAILGHDDSIGTPSVPPTVGRAADAVGELTSNRSHRVLSQALWTLDRIQRQVLPKLRVKRLEQTRERAGDQVISWPRPKPIRLAHGRTVPPSPAPRFDTGLRRPQASRPPISRRPRFPATS